MEWPEAARIAIELVQCPSCRQEQRPRSDRICPACGVALDPFGQDGTGAIVFYEDRPEGRTQFNSDATAMRVAGVILLLNAALAVVALATLPRVGFEFPVTPLAQDDWHASRDFLHDRRVLLASIVADLFIGGWLLAVRRGILPLAIGRAVVGGIVLTAVSISDDDLRGAILQVGFSGAQLLLLWGRAESGRIIAGAVCAAATFGLFFLHVGLGAMEDPPKKPVDRSRYGLPGPPITAGPPPPDPARLPPERLLDVGGDVAGYTYPIEMERPARYWQLRPADHALRADDDAQFWWVEPRSFAELRILRHVPSMGVTLSIEAERFTRRLRNHWESWEGVGSGPAFHAQVERELPPDVGEARITVSGARHRIHVEVHAVGSAAWAIIYSAPEGVYDEYLPDVREAVAALEF